MSSTQPVFGQGSSAETSAAPAVDFDGPHATQTRREQRIALRGHFFEGHVRRVRSDPERYSPNQGFEFMSGLGCTLIASYRHLAS